MQSAEYIHQQGKDIVIQRVIFLMEDVNQMNSALLFLLTVSKLLALQSSNAARVIILQMLSAL
jgi:archaellum biogenesis protein FlaJ (TadC family)